LPADQARFVRPRRRRSRRLWIVAVLAVIVFGLLALQAIADLYTDYLWYRSESITYVWRSITETKLGLAAVFTGIMFVGLWSSLYAVDRMSTRVQLYAPELDLVRRYQTVIGHRSVLVRTVVAAIIAFVVGEGAASQWQNWILFNNEHSFGVTDPLFGRDAGFFVFRLPFLDFVVNWTLLALIVILLVTAVFHYLNGGIRFQGGGPHVDPVTVAHLSLILGLAAFVKAVSYYYVQRFELEYSTRGVVQGAGYTDVHVILPAYTLLAVVALVAFALLVFNVYQRSLSLPLIGIGLWLIVALSVGIIYPALLQAFRVTPAQSTLELPYIQDNIRATNYAYGLQNVAPPSSYPAKSSVSAAAATTSYSATLDDPDLWDPQQTATTFQKLQDERNFFNITGLAVDRYTIGKTVVPEVVGVRTVTTSGLPSSSWVNTHLAYTHGYGAVMAAANTGNAIGDPSFSIDNLPPASVGADTPKVTTPQVYFGAQSSNYVVVDSAQKEIDYTTGSDSANVEQESNYKGDGGIPVGSFWTRAAFALRFHDLNLLISKLITPQSRIIFVQDVTQMVQKAAPFLQVDSNPYPVIDNGQIYWMVDAYTTTSAFPYSQSANTSALPSSSGLQGSYNYIRNSVVVTINAYTGAMSFYQLPLPGGETDPLLDAWMDAFPGMFQPYSAMPPTLAQHLRYPQDMLSVQATMYGRYHVTNPASFYSGASAWEVAQSPGTGAPTQAPPTNSDGSVVRDTPTYELLQLDPTSTGSSGSTAPPAQPSFVALDPMVPYSQGDKLQTLSGFLIAGCDQNSYGQITMYKTPTSPNGPALVDSEIDSNTGISAQITVLDQKGSIVTTGAMQVLPVDGGLIYLTPLYVSSATNQFPQLKYVVAVLGNTVALGSSSSPGGARAQALQQVLSSAVPVGQVGPQGIPTAPQAADIRNLLNEALQVANDATAALQRGDLAGYQADEDQVTALLKAAKNDLAEVGTKPSSSGATAPPSTTTTTVPSTAPTTTTTSATVPPASTTSTTSTTTPPTAGTA
jgi:hypothetical protein